MSTAEARKEVAAALDKLPEGSVVADVSGDIFQLRGDLWCSYDCAPLDSYQLAKYRPITTLRHGGTK